MLSAGGTKHHSELLAPFGLDARDPAFWQGGLSVIERHDRGAGGWSGSTRVAVGKTGSLERAPRASIC